MQMNLPPLYKYLDVVGARLTLQNCTFKHSKPSDFNDTEDLTVKSIFPETQEEALEIIKNNFADAILKNINERPTSLNIKIRAQIALFQAIFRKNPDAVEIIGQEMKKGALAELYDLEGLKKRSEGYLDEINTMLQRIRVLCVSATNNSEAMWLRYAQQHEGIILRITPSIEKDSKFTLFRKVTYCETRPPLYKNALDFSTGSLFGDQERKALEAIDTIVYSKTMRWKEENEYRLAIPLRDGEDWNTLLFHPEEITELYFGLKTAPEFVIELSDLAAKLNPSIKFVRASAIKDGLITFQSCCNQSP